jgi:hypothetical protein
MSLHTFAHAYAECAYWASTDDNGDPLDHSDATPADETPAALYEQAREFYEAHAALWSDLDDYSDEQAGHDFWLTRNRHGAGFWDRGIGEAGRKLTEIAHTYGECDLYIGDDNRIHVA